MANNFRVPATTNGINYYISKAGNDANDGLTPDTPKLTYSGVRAAIVALQSPTVVKIIIGTGTYEEGVSGTPNIAMGSTMVGDGNVVFKGTGASTFSFNATQGITLNNLTLKDYGTISLNGGLSDCVFYNISNQLILALSSIATRCKFISIINQTAIFQYNYCLFIDVNLSGNNSFFTNSYFNSNSRITLQSLNQVTAANIDYNNIMGMVRVLSTGTYKSLSTFKADNPGYFLNSFSAPPLFNNAAKLDFTLLPESLHLGAAQNGVDNIGGTLLATALATDTSSEWKPDNDAIISNSNNTPDLVFSGTDLVLAPGKVWGQITSAPILAAANPVQIQSINYNGFLLFNKSTSGGSTSNNNVPDSAVYAGNNSTGAGNPDRLSYEMRWTDADAKPNATTNTDWISTPLVSAGTFISFEWNVQPLFDSAGIGNGSSLFNKNASPSPVNAKWVQIRVTLTNQYV
ncbi:hypothetical protein [Mucilaginibacter terrae]|uniref:DUF1565 domain-containing protein n=1 Tax=Mucilaginibacter terrae TaxID=1955052 RepID=A0ABU3H2F5_9SPHI|nr:hypothetical protein [Mucilaginibacter terrae]MDT3405095.1 hypothetical protein [Mucilaginibacter terrae]